MSREWLKVMAVVAVVSSGTLVVLQTSTVFATCPNNQCDKQHSLIEDTRLECDDCWETVTESWIEVCTTGGTAPDRQCDDYSAVIKRVSTYGCNGQDECELLSVVTTQGTRCDTNACP